MTTTASGPMAKHVPAELRQRRQWVAWRYEVRHGKKTKVPVDPCTGRLASSTDPATWSTLQDATKFCREKHADGVGFVFADYDPYSGVDLDGCYLSDGTIDPAAQAVIAKLNSYSERSVSGSGVHIIVKATLPPGGRRRGKIEVYDQGRFFVVTGDHLPGTPTTVEHRQAELEALHREVFAVADREAATDTPLPGRLIDVDDAALLARARQAANGDKFARLWAGDTSEYNGDDSAADLALCNSLGFWTGKDAARMDRLFRQSGLFRPKWDQRHYGDGRTYGQATIETALASFTQGYTGPSKPIKVGNVSNNGTRPHDGGSEDEEPWPARADLPPATPAVPTLEPDMLPEPLRPWLVDIAGRACIPLEFVACPALVALGAVVGRTVGIRPARFDDWLVVPNLWGAIIGRPGLLKTYAVSEALKPLARLAHEANENHKQALALGVAKLERLKVEADAIRRKMGEALKKAPGASLATHEADLAAKLQEQEQAATTERRYMTQDATVEKLGELLRENPRGLLVGRDELAGWLRTLERPGREGDREFFLEAWNGTGSFTFDRVGRGTVHIDAVTVSLVGGIQPGKLLAHVQDALRGEIGADGLLQRFQILVWPNQLGEWREPTRWPESAARNRAFDVFGKLDGLKPDQLGATCEDGEIPYLRFDDHTQALFGEWRGELERRLRSDELATTPTFESHLAKYRSLMPSLALLFHLVDYAGGGAGGLVREESALLAAAWCDFLEAHARKLYAAELSPGTQGGRKIAEKIENGVVLHGDSVRDIYRHSWEGLETSDQVKAALKVLAEAGWLRTVIIDHDGGGRPSEVLYLHPDFRGEPR